MLDLTVKGRRLLGFASLSIIATLGVGFLPPPWRKPRGRAPSMFPQWRWTARWTPSVASPARTSTSIPTRSRVLRRARFAAHARQRKRSARRSRARASPCFRRCRGLVVANDIVVTARRDEAETSVLVRQASSSDRNGLGLRGQPRNTQIITAKTIEEQQALNITDILRNAGGVSTFGNTPNSGASYTIRGFSAGGLVNGLTTTSQYGVNAGADQPVANIERVEVLKGPDALLAGFGNLGGNINVVTKKPSAEERLAVGVDTGSFGLVRGVIDANKAITADNKLSGRVIASAQTMDHNYGGYTGDKNWLFAPTLRYKDRLTDIVVGASINEGISGIGAFTLFDNKTRQIIDRDPSRPIYADNQGIRINTSRFYFDATRQVIPGIDLVLRGMHDQTLLTTRAANVGYSRAGALIADTQGSRQDGSSNAFDGFVRIKTHIGDDVKASFNVGYNYSDGSGEQQSGTVYNRATNPSLTAATPLVVVPWSPFGNVQIRTGGKQEGCMARP
ncbi:TonB-dependent receptor plug domain-containing protein [Sphingomonas sp. I4]